MLVVLWHRSSSPTLKPVSSFSPTMSAPLTTTPSFDVIVVGCGVAGGALTNVLARDGRRVLCIERHLYSPTSPSHFAAPARIVGELLQPGGYAALCALGLSDALDGIDAQQIEGYAIFLDGRPERLPYNEEQGDANVLGRSFHNGRFLKRLREIASENHNVTLVEGNVIALDTDPSGNVVGVSYSARENKKLVKHARAKLTIACDGCGSKLRKRAAGHHFVTVYSNFHGLILDMDNIPFPNYGHVVLSDPSPVLFYPISSTEVRCLVDVPSTYRGDATHYMMETVAPQLPEKFQTPFLHAVNKGNARMMPNRAMPAAVDMVPGAILLGDSFNMRHPLTGGGMTVALSDVRIIRQLLTEVPDLADADVVAEKLAMFCELRKPMSTTINILANALYTLFCAKEDPALKEMRSACVDYLSRGGRMTNDPIRMLGGLKPQRYLLLAHFFAVALYGCGKALLPFPTPSRVTMAWSIFRASFNIMKPLANAEHLWPLSWLPIDAL